MSAQPPLNNHVKRLVLADRLALGLIVRVCRSSEIALVARQSGHDFIFIDTQHSAFDLETISNLSIAALAMGISPLVRVRGYDDPDIPVLLDAGVAGVIVPDVADADQARQVVRTCKYPPQGARSFAGPTISLAYAAVPPAEASRRLNEETLVVCMIENRRGLANVDEIAKVDGVDILHVGCGDLLMDMGKPGEFDSPEIAAAVSTVIQACKDAGKIAGFGGDRNRDRQRRYIQEGVRFVTTQADIALLLQAAIASVVELRPDA
ncbi:aldolase/citrate lyase family protein [Aminobacter sp. AP02]|uniref:HpcH/HpaI aldolase family protein n=1 Tax=Aminobacter sp. AP02 TaxID=2135737 RepID=UPI000D6C82F6|nr:aldolase/citrate lyase family protein [Aminobacter sp. AP02]PWK61282.1 2-keto-3-deoxy-L-rhamnonate aldolase RhmA [Aminobacter sp. AP02]